MATRERTWGILKHVEGRMYRITTILAVATLALGAAACGEHTTAPADEAVNVDLVAADDYGFVYGRGPGAGCETGPGTCFGAGSGAGTNRSYLGTLVQQAYQALVAAEGQAAADAKLAVLWKLHQDAFALRATDHDAFVAALQAAHLESVKLVLEVLGAGVVPTVIGLAEEQIEALEAKLAAAPSATRLQYVADRAAAYLADARAAFAAGNLVTALDLGSRALQAATVGGGQNARGQGAGTGNGSGRQYRGGR
jgi:hypothetical protein